MPVATRFAYAQIEHCTMAEQCRHLHETLEALGIHLREPRPPLPQHASVALQQLQAIAKQVDELQVTLRILHRSEHTTQSPYVRRQWTLTERNKA